MKYTFNLLDKPWVPCTDSMGYLKTLSLNELISRAQTLSAISSHLPVINAAIYQLVIALLSRVYTLTDLDDWEKLWKTGHFTQDKLASYTEKWHGRFNLLDEIFPFYQDSKIGFRAKDIKNLDKNDKPAEKSFTGHLLHLASGSNATLFDHTLDSNETSYPLGLAAQYLVMLQAYSLGGMGVASIGKDKFYKDAAFSRGIFFLCRGDNLFETLMRNLVPQSFNFMPSTEEDIPCWERNDPFEPERSAPTGLIDLLTWQSRRIRLVPELKNGQVMVKNCFSAPGLSLAESFVNPFYLNEHASDGEKQEVKLMRFQMNRALWRDSAAILDRDRRLEDKPVCKRLFEKLRFEGILEDPFIRLVLSGTLTEPGKKKAYRYQEEVFNAPAVYLDRPDLYQQLQEALALAEAMRSCLYFATYTLASFKMYPEQDSKESFSPDKKIVGALYQHIEQEAFFWSRLEAPFYRLLNTLPINALALTEWKETLNKYIHESLARAGELTGDDFAGLKARAKAENRLFYEVSKRMNPEKKEE
ncbi:MAG: type I-E CRISPR-associated protein Cse1/CasA [Anaerolineaceae bacterium]|nr:type I-E CRISPR-associated protein Cse1/CasA [Anaerolineaceae bacterium]